MLILLLISVVQLSSYGGDLMAIESEIFTTWPFPGKVCQALLNSPGLRSISWSKFRQDLGLGLSSSVTALSCLLYNEGIFMQEK